MVLRERGFNVDHQLGYLAPFLWRSAVFGPGLTFKNFIVDNAYRKPDVFS